MLGLNTGELVMVAFVVGAVLSARYWPRLGAEVAAYLTSFGRNGRQPGSKP